MGRVAWRSPKAILKLLGTGISHSLKGDVGKQEECLRILREWEEIKAQAQVSGLVQWIQNTSHKAMGAHDNDSGDICKESS